MDQLLRFWAMKWASLAVVSSEESYKMKERGGHRIQKNDEEILKEGKYKIKLKIKRNKSEK